MSEIPTWAVILHSGRILAIGARDEEQACAVYGYVNDVREVEPYDPLRHLFGRDLAEWKRITGYVEPEITPAQQAVPSTETQYDTARHSAHIPITETVPPTVKQWYTASDGTVIPDTSSKPYTEPVEEIPNA